MCMKRTSSRSIVTANQPTQIIGWKQNVNKLMYWKIGLFNQNHLQSFDIEEDTKVSNTVIGNEVTLINLSGQVET